MGRAADAAALDVAQGAIPSLNTTTANSYQNLFGMLNTSYGPLKDAKVRQALAYATDYKGLVAAIGAFTPSIGIIPDGLWGYDANLPVLPDRTWPRPSSSCNRRATGRAASR